MEPDGAQGPSRLGLLSHRLKSFGYVTFTLGLGLGLGALHSYHVATMFENSRQFSYLSPLEREMSMKTEMGLYYSFYKTIVEAKSFSGGIASITNDKMIEYPDIINAMKRFNIYPEVVAGYLYHSYMRYCSESNIENKKCYIVDRIVGGQRTETITCEGLGEPIYFYLMLVWVLAGFTVFLIFLYGLYLSRNIFGAIMAAACYFFNHSEATRIQWTPPLRENFAYPFLLLHMLVTTILLRKASLMGFKAGVIQVWIMGLSGSVCLICWQFSQFIMLTQLMLLSAMEQFKIISPFLFFSLLSGHSISIHIAILIMQGNKMLISSFYLSIACSLTINSIFWNHFLREKTKRHTTYEHIIFFIKNMVMITCLTIIFKLKFSALVGSDDDSHIMQLLKSKFTSFQNFHTMLYTCSAEFDFLPYSTLLNLTGTFLLPCALLAIFVIFIYWTYVSLYMLPTIGQKKNRKHKPTDNAMNNEKNTKSNKNNKGHSNAEPKSWFGVVKNLLGFGDEGKSVQKRRRNNVKRHFVFDIMKCFQVEPEIVFNIAQLIIFFILAVLIMRLKLFLTPHLCIVAALITTRRYYHWFVNTNNHMLMSILFLILITCMSLKGTTNLITERNIVGQFSNEPLEELLVWIDKNTEKTASFAGPMPITSAIYLSTRRPIVNHPHYEDANLRARTMLVYSAFSRQSATQLYIKLTKLKTAYLVIDDIWCFYKSAKGCTMLDIWDVEEPHLMHKPSLCAYLTVEKNIPHFHRVFSNSQFVVLKVHDNAVNIKIPNYKTYIM